jgi:hypothetical protein
MLEAYCTRRSYVVDNEIGLHISTDAPSVHIRVIRDGRHPLTVLERMDIPGSHYGVPKDVVANGCGWPIGFSFKPGRTWRSGFYRVVLVGSGGETAEASFVLRESSPNSRILWVIETNTWNAYNFFGGQSTYTDGGGSYSGGAPRVSFLRPWPRGFVSLPANAPRLATVGVVDTSVPYAAWAAKRGLTIWTGAASWGQWGSKFAAWLDAENIAVDYAVSSDLEEFPGLLEGYKLMLSVGHDEYWSWGMRDTVEAFIARGGNVAFFSGNLCYWQVRLENDFNQMVAFKSGVERDPVMGTELERHNTGIWSHRLTRRPENQLTGVSFTRGGYARCARAVPASAGGYTIYRANHWALEGSGLSYGDQLGSAYSLIGYECDGCAFQFQHGLPVPTAEDGTPANFEIIAIAPVTLFSRENAPEGLYPPNEMTDLELVTYQVTGRSDPQSLRQFEHGHAVMGTYVAPGGGTVFTAGTTEWAHALRDPQVAHISRNVIERLS